MEIAECLTILAGANADDGLAPGAIAGIVVICVVILGAAGVALNSRSWLGTGGHRWYCESQRCATWRCGSRRWFRVVEAWKSKGTAIQQNEKSAHHKRSFN